MALFGVFGSHTTEACPLFNTENRKLLLHTAAGLKDLASRFGIEIVAAYHSGLEHTFVWVVESDNAHAIQDLLLETQMAKWNTAKIVPLTTLEGVVENCRALES